MRASIARALVLAAAACSAVALTNLPLPVDVEAAEEHQSSAPAPPRAIDDNVHSSEWFLHPPPRKKPAFRITDFIPMTDDPAGHRTDLEDSVANTRFECEKKCPGVIFIFARGTWELGALGEDGLHIAEMLVDEYGDNVGIWLQGVAGSYKARLRNIWMPKRSSYKAIREAVKLLYMASDWCPESRIVAGGYSQGGALMNAAISLVHPEVQAKVAGVAFLGSMKHHENDGNIKGFPPDKVKSFCNKGDRICKGQFLLGSAHSNYDDVAYNGAPEFLIEKLKPLLAADAERKAASRTAARCFTT